MSPTIPSKQISAPPNRFDLQELAGAFGDLGTLLPFVIAYVTLLGMAPAGILLAFGTCMIVAGWIYRTPFPVQPMKAIGAVAIVQAAGGAELTPMAVIGAGLATGLMWSVLAITGLAQRAAGWVPRSALLGVVLGLGFSFMLEGLRMMGQVWWISATLLALTLWLMARSKPLAVLGLMVAGVAIALAQQPALLADMGRIHVQPTWPDFAWPALVSHDLWLGLVLLALPQLPLTFGNAFIAITDENNRLFPDRPVTLGSVAWSTGLMNLWGSAVGGVPMCHGAGGMAGHVKFGARTGGASIMLGAFLVLLGLLFADSVTTIFRIFPASVLGVILFIAGAELALSSRDPSAEKEDRFVVIATAALAIGHVGVAIVFGILAHAASRRGWLRF